MRAFLWKRSAVAIPDVGAVKFHPGEMEMGILQPERKAGFVHLAMLWGF